jgi:hypothetical protein
MPDLGRGMQGMYKVGIHSDEESVGWPLGFSNDARRLSSNVLVPRPGPSPAANPKLPGMEASRVFRA